MLHHSFNLLNWNVPNFKYGPTNRHAPNHVQW